MKVVIVGGGFGGIKAALCLANKKGIEVKLISGQAYFEYHAALYRSATGHSPLEVVIPLRDFFAYAKNIEVMEDTIISIDNNDQYITGESDSKYHYDELMLALGNVTEYYGIKGLQQYAYGVKTIHEALRLKRHLHEQLLTAEKDHNYVVIGAGATGVELSAELATYMKKVRKKHGIKHAFRVQLIEAAPRVLTAMPEDISTATTKKLQKLGVNIKTSTAVTAETAAAIRLQSHQKGSIHSRSVVWTAGIANNPLFAQFPQLFRTGKLGRVQVDPYLRAAPHIYVLGDSALTPYSGMAQTAMYDAQFITGNILRQVRGKVAREYVPKKPIYAIPVGARWAAVLWGGVRIYGRLGWMLRRLADLRLYITFLPPRKALTAWHYGSVVDEAPCPICKT